MSIIVSGLAKFSGLFIIKETINVPVYAQTAKVLAGDASAGDQFSISVGISSDGTAAIVGSVYDDNANGQNAGAAYVFTRSGSTWTQQQKLIASDGATSDRFGRAVAISEDGNTAVVGAFFNDNANGSDAGAAYVFTRSGPTWTQQQKLIASDGAGGDWFGHSLAISGDGNTIVVGAYYDDNTNGTDAGAAYVFTRSSSVWTEQQKLIAPSGAASDWFGYSMSVSNDGNTVIVGSPNDDQAVFETGAVYVFVRSGNTWVVDQKLMASDAGVGDKFGISVALSNNAGTILIAAYNDELTSPTRAGAGSAYIFTNTGSSWQQQAKLTASDATATDQFGVSAGISADGNIAVLGAWQQDTGGSDAGAAYVYARDGSTWSQSQKLVASDAAASDYFGWSIGISSSNNIVIVGAITEDDGGSDAGAAYMFTGT